MRLVRSGAPSFDTIYIGGGTPSLLSGKEVNSILSAARANFKIQSQSEITLEVNPGTITRSKLDAYRQAGVNRVSVGVQSFNNRLLNVLGRIHNAKTAMDCIKVADRSGYGNIGIDLIYAIPDQTLAEWKEDLFQALKLRPHHISCYMLTVEPGTPFEIDRANGQIEAVSESIVADMFQTTVKALTDGGYVQYEISNFCLPGYHSRHNSKYWDGSPYFGLGAGAHCFDGERRSWNHRNIEVYINALTARELPLEGEESLTRDKQMLERIFLGLRTTWGIDMVDLNRRFGVDLKTDAQNDLEDLVKKGFITQKSNRIALTAKGMLVLDSIVHRINDTLETSA